jgi:predicted nucleic acid-binding protein
MKKLFLDANILFSAAYREKAGLVKLWQLKKVKLYSSLYAVEEAERNLEKAEQKKRLTTLLEKIELVGYLSGRSFIPTDIELRDKDKPILEAAIQMKADYLITGDFRDFGQHFGKKIAGVVILPPAAFFEIMTR